MTIAMIASDTVSPAVAPSEYPMRPTGGSRGRGAGSVPELDLDRVIYDPEYRARMRDVLNGRDPRARQR